MSEQELYTEQSEKNIKKRPCGGRWLKILCLILLIGFILESAAFVAFLQYFTFAKPDLEYRKLKEIWQVLQKNYYQELSTQELWEAAYRGLPAQVGSKFTRYMDKKEVEMFEESISGEYYGIGAVVSQNDKGQISISEIFKGSPAEKAGLQAGDIFIEIDGHKADEFSDPTALASFVRGAENTEVIIKVQRLVAGQNSFEELSFNVKRGKVDLIEVISKDLPELEAENIGYIRIREFTANLAEQFIPILKAEVAKGKNKIIIDLRNNPGGDAEAMTKALDAILPAGLIAKIEGRYNGQAYEKKWVTKDGTEIPESVQFAILLNKNSASASEFFSGALRDRGRAKLIGEQSYGKGVATQSHYLSDGSAVNVTTFRYILPKGESLDGVGLKPDIKISLDADIQNKNIESLSYAEDAQLQRAVSYFNSGK